MVLSQKGAETGRSGSVLSGAGGRRKSAAGRVGLAPERVGNAREVALSASSSEIEALV